MRLKNAFVFGLFTMILTSLIVALDGSSEERTSYALKENNDAEHAFRVRKILINASTDKSITTKERIEAIFEEEGIPYAAFDAKPAFDAYNVLLKEDNIKSTPTCVIVKSGQKKSFVGGKGIVNALKSLQ